MAVHYPDDAAIALIGEAMIARTLPKAEWTHAAHFATALWLIRCRPDFVPERDMPDMIRGYNVSVGGVNDDHEGYHETITQASLRAARSMPADTPLHEALDVLMASDFGRRNWLLTYWTRECLFSVEARRAWVEPDRAPLPF